MTYLPLDPDDDDSYARHLVPQADQPAPWLRGSRATTDIVWNNIWLILAYGQWLTMDDFAPDFVGGIRRDTLRHLLRRACEAGFLAQRPRSGPDPGVIEYSRHTGNSSLSPETGKSGTRIDDLVSTQVGIVVRDKSDTC